METTLEHEHVKVLWEWYKSCTSLYDKGTSKSKAKERPDNEHPHTNEWM